MRELDEAMTEVRKVRKVSEGTEAQYKSFQQTVSSTAQEIASTNKELINSSADFSRLGYSLEQAESLAKNTTLFVNVGDGIDITAATEDMITAMKAFDIKAEDSIKIVDNYNQIGNKFALSATDIGEAMKRSASALETGNNCLE
ncbi:phage tail tape measure protein [Roseburia hominis]|nr:phage tail tape measure protein [Roseburia hominis]